MHIKMLIKVSTESLIKEENLYLANNPDRMTDDSSNSDPFIYDTEILHYIKEAITSIKQQDNHTSQAQILAYLKTQMPSNRKIMNLTEDHLDAHLKKAVNDGLITISNQKADTHVYRLPAGQLTLKSHTIQGKQLTDLLQILMRSLASLNQQSVVMGMHPDEIQLETLQTEATSSIDSICSFLRQNFCFEVDNVSGQGDSKSHLADVLKECVKYLIRKNKGRIFVCPDEVASGGERFKLNLVYIHQKLLEQKEKRKKSAICGDQDLVKYSRDLIGRWIRDRIEGMIEEQCRRVLKFRRGDKRVSFLNLEDSVWNLNCSSDGNSEIGASLVEAVDVFVDSLDSKCRSEMVEFAKGELEMWIKNRIREETDRFCSEV